MSIIKSKFLHLINAYSLNRLLVIILLLIIATNTIAAPWMTGPLLAPAGKTIPAGHINYEPYGFYTDHPLQYKNLSTTQLFTFGLTPWMDLQISVPFDYNWRTSQHGSGVGDVNIAFGFQFLRQNNATSMPDLRVMLQETLPTGRYENLSFQKKGTDQTGAGAYQTAIIFNFQKLQKLYDEHYIRTRLSLVASKASKVKVRGLNAYGGSLLTRGTIEPTSSYSADLAFEYSATQNWVPVFEVLYLHNSAVNFNGRPGFTPGRMVAGIGDKQSDQLSFAPALEYNFSSNIGMIGGIWFLASGPRVANFTSAVLAINIYM